MTGSTYAPQRWEDVEASKVQPNIVGVTGTISFGQTQNVDFLVADDSFIRGIQLMCKSQIFGDILTVSVIDKNGVYFPANTVVSTPVNNFNIVADQQKQADYESVDPFKILGGLFVRFSYTSLGLVNVGFEANLILLKVLV